MEIAQTAPQGRLAWLGRFRLRGLALALVLAGLLAGAARHAASGGTEATDNAQIEADLVPVPVRTAGVIERLLFAENQPVEAGQLLAALDAAPQRARLARAEAELAVAGAAARAAEAEIRIAQANARGQRSIAAAIVLGSRAGVGQSAEEIAQARAQVAGAESALHQAELEEARARALHAERALTRQRLDAAEGARAAAAAALVQARARLAAVGHAPITAGARLQEARARLQQTSATAVQIEEARARLEGARAQVAVAAAARDLAALDLSYTRVTAPRAGLASRRVVVVGQSVAAGQTLVTIVPLDDLRVVANFKESQLEHLRPGQEAEIRVDAFARARLRGQVESLSGATGSRFSLLPPDNATGNFVKVVQRVPVRLRVLGAPAGLPLRPGLSVEVTVQIER